MRKQPKVDKVDLSTTAETGQKRIGNVLRDGLHRHMGLETCPAQGAVELARQAACGPT